MANTWLNSDNLYVKFGAAEGTSAHAGEYEFDGPNRYIEITIPDMTVLTNTDTIIAGTDTTWLPKGAFIEQVIVETFTGVTSAGSATLDVGLVNNSDRSTVISATGIVAGLAKASVDTAGKLVTLTTGVTSAGAKIGVALSQTGGALFTAKWNTAAFTAGKLAVRVYYSIPTT